MKTIKQIADEIGVSKQAVFYRIRKEPLSNKLDGLISKENGVLMISLDGENLIKEAFNIKNEDIFVDKETPNKYQNENSFDGVLMVLKEQLEVKDNQLEVANATIRELTSTIEVISKSLANSQALHAGTMQKQLQESETEKEEEEVEIIEEKPSFWQRVFGKKE